MDMGASSDKTKATRVSSPLSVNADSPLLGQGDTKGDGKLKPSASSSSGLGGALRLRSALSSMNLSASFKEDEGAGSKVPKRSASFNNLSAVLKKGMGLGKHDKRDKGESRSASDAFQQH